MYVLDTEEEPHHWPAPVGGTGTPRLFADGFAHPDGRARLVAVEPQGPADDLRGQHAASLDQIFREMYR